MSEHRKDETKRQADHKWTKGEWVGEGQGEGPRTDTGEYSADQWVGEGQGKDRAEDQDQPRKPKPEPDK